MHGGHLLQTRADLFELAGEVLREYGWNGYDNRICIDKDIEKQIFRMADSPQFDIVHFLPSYDAQVDSLRTMQKPAG